MSHLPTSDEILELFEKHMIIEAREKIVQLREAAISAKEENLQLRTRLRDLEKQNDLETHLRFRDNKLELKKDGCDSGPYCHLCWEKDRKLIHLEWMPARRVPAGNDIAAHYKCRGCKEHFRAE